MLVEHEITTPIRLAHFLAQVLHETGGLTIEWENMNYSAPRLMEIFGVGKHSAKVREDEAQVLAHNPALIAERVYGRGNPAKARELGNTEKGDGYQYRGGGLMQTTGRANYRETGKRCGVDFEHSPKLIVSAEHALKPALIEWTRGKLNTFADADDVLSISRAINIGNPRSTRTPNGLGDRQRWLKRTRALCAGVSIETGRNARRVTRSAAAAPHAMESAAQPAQVVRPELLDIQQRLSDMKLYLKTVDGLFGSATKTAIQALCLNQSVKNFDRWPDERLIVAARQLFCRIDGIDVGDIDGLVGPRTEQAFAVYAARQASGRDHDPAVENWRDEPAPPAAEAKPSRPAGKGPVWPRQSEVEAFFGAPGSGQTTLELPFRMRIAWDPGKTVTRVSCHTKVRANLERIWVRTLNHYGLPEIQRLRLDMFGGCLNVRLMRGGTKWSMHSWGIAWDVDPARNALKMGRDQATLAAPEYKAFWGFVYDEGAISLGRERNFDWMHFQFARL
jgi:predicted chitinase/peptidoglycan hydrolase-like protein with peptidoglycan-binding domain